MNASTKEENLGVGQKVKNEDRKPDNEAGLSDRAKLGVISRASDPSTMSVMTFMHLAA